MRGMKRSERIWADERKGLTDEGINVGKDAEDPWEKPNLRPGSWVYVTSFVSHVVPFEDLREAAEQTEPTGAPLPFQDDSHVHLPRVEVRGRSVSRSDGHHGTEGALGPLGRVMAASCCFQAEGCRSSDSDSLWVAGPRVPRCFSIFVLYFCSGGGAECLHLLLFHVLTSFNIRVPAEF